MSLDIRIQDLSLRDVLASSPKISDQLEAVCRTLDFTIKQTDEIGSLLGQHVELWYADQRWFYGSLFQEEVNEKGELVYKAYDPLYYFKQCPDDYYFKNMTATQIISDLADKTKIAKAALANTGVVFPQLYYQNTQPDKIVVDVLARTYQANEKKKFWFRFNPDKDKGGLELFERLVPAEIWAFETGANLTGAKHIRSIEDTRTEVKLVNRETKQIVIRTNDAAEQQYGRMVHFEEAGKDDVGTMVERANKKLAELSKMKTTMAVAGSNVDQMMPQFFSGDVIYVEEKHTNLIGAYHIRNVTQTIVNEKLINLDFDIQAAPEIPTVQYKDAEKDPDKKG